MNPRRSSAAARRSSVSRQPSSIRITDRPPSHGRATLPARSALVIPLLARYPTAPHRITATAVDGIGLSSRSNEIVLPVANITKRAKADNLNHLARQSSDLRVEPDRDVRSRRLGSEQSARRPARRKPALGVIERRRTRDGPAHFPDAQSRCSLHLRLLHRYLRKHGRRLSADRSHGQERRTVRPR